MGGAFAMSALLAKDTAVIAWHKHVRLQAAMVAVVVAAVTFGFARLF
jgi:hypothetical protein